MIVTLKLTNGTVQTLDVATIETILGASPIELSFDVPARLRMQARCDEKRWHTLAVYPGAANLVEISAKAHDRSPE